MRRKQREERERAARSLELLANAAPGDILLFFRPSAGLGLLISILTRSPFYHVALYDGELHTIEARQRGVVRRDLRSHEGGHLWRVIAAPGARRREALDWAHSQIGDSFDRLDLLVILLDRVFLKLKLHYAPFGKYSCGEFVATAFARAGAPLFPELALSDVEPADFARLLPGRQHRRPAKVGP